MSASRIAMVLQKRKSLTLNWREAPVEGRVALMQQ
jgi:hypothetical protein